MNTSNLQSWPSCLPPSDVPTPYIMVDPQRALFKLKELRKYLPSVDIYYAVKSFDNAQIVDVLKGEVRGFDVASLGEIKKLNKLGVRAKDMIFSNPVKIPSHIREAYKLGVTTFGFDSVEEIVKLATNAPKSNIHLRIRVGDTGSKFPLSKKFGAEPSQAVAFAATATDHGLQFKGISFHVGSQSETTVAWENAINIAGEIIINLEKTGINIEFLNIGGGFPAPYAEPVISIKDLSAVISQSLKQHIPKEVKIIAEPGRFISAESAVIVASVVGSAYRSGSHWLYLDVGTFQGLIEPLEIPEWKYPVMNLDRAKAKKTDSFVLTGPTCDAFDTVGMDYVLPKDTSVGDRILIGSAGAYTLVYASSFNGFDPPKVIYV